MPSRNSLSYDLCSARHCNVCLLLQLDQEQMKLENNIKIATNSPTENANNQQQQLRKCNGCQLVQYCGTEHQKLDWPLHKEFCQATQKILKTYKVKHPYYLTGEPPRNPHSMERAILQIKYLLRIALGRSLEFHEEEFTSFPPHCAICFSFKGLQTCKNCQAISYCSQTHAQEDATRHKEICGFLKIYYCAYKVLPVPEDIVSDFYERVRDLHKTDLFDAFQRATLKLLPALPADSLNNYQLYATAADLSCVATICYALNFVEMRCYDNNKFVIFIVGATVERELWFRNIHTKFFFLQYPQITYLQLYFIGPELKPAEQQVVSYNFQGMQRTVLYSSHCDLFQNFMSRNATRPSLIIVYNCGFSEYAFQNDEAYKGALRADKNNKTLPALTDSSRIDDTWPAGIRDILQTNDLPIVFTSFTSMEADFDYAALLRIAQTDDLRIRVERLFSVQKNPYHDLRPLRKWHISDKEEIYYRNGYVQAVRTSLEF